MDLSLFNTSYDPAETLKQRAEQGAAWVNLYVVCVSTFQCMTGACPILFPVGYLEGNIQTPD